MEKEKRRYSYLKGGVLVFVLIMMLSAGSALAAEYNYSMSITGKADYASAYSMLTSINNLRASVNASPLSYDAELSRLAMQRAAETYFLYSHDKPNGLTWKEWSSANSKVDGENITNGFTSWNSAFNGWKNSTKGHYENMVSTGYRSIGIACFVVGNEFYWVQEFSKGASSGGTVPASKTQTFTVELKDSTDNAYYLRDSSGYASLVIDVGTSESIQVNKQWKEKTLTFDPSLFNWSSSDSSIAAVNQNGSVRANKAGTVTIYAEPKNGYGRKVSISAVCGYYLANGKAKVSGIPSSLIYTGSEFTPAPTVSFDGYTLTKDVDYTVSYRNNTLPGSASVTITGKGNYYGTVTMGFVILEITDLSDLKAELKGNGRFNSGTDRNYVWNNMTLSYRGTVIDKSQYSLSTVSSYNGQISYFGVYMRHGFAGTKTFYCAGDFQVNSIPAQTYTGSYIRPKLTVYRDSSAASSYSPTPLKEGTDYKVSYTNNVNPGTATVIIQGMGSYIGTYTTGFVIKKKSSSGGNSSGNINIGSPDTPGRSSLSNASLSDLSAQVTKTASEKDQKGSSFALLQAKATAKSKTSVKITWKKVPSAKKYLVYGSQCGKANKYVLLKTVSGKTFTHKKLKAGTYYKYLVAAVNGDTVLAISKTLHVATKGGKVGNTKKVTVSVSRINLTKGKTASIKAKAIAESKKLKVKKHRGLAYESTNLSVASVSSKGVIKALSKGSCYVYVYAQNGVCQKVRVTVS